MVAYANLAPSGDHQWAIWDWKISSGGEKTNNKLTLWIKSVIQPLSGLVMGVFFFLYIPAIKSVCVCCGRSGQKLIILFLCEMLSPCWQFYGCSSWATCSGKTLRVIANQNKSRFVSGVLHPKNSGLRGKTSQPFFSLDLSLPFPPQPKKCIVPNVEVINHNSF